MNWRRIIYVALVVFVAAVLFRNVSGGKTPPPEPLIDQQRVLHEFKQPGRQDYTEGDYQPDSIYFPYDYTGDRGDEFYLTIKNKEGIATLKYVLKKNSSGELEYELKNRWQDVNLPYDRFESYRFEDNDWVNVNRL